MLKWQKKSNNPIKNSLKNLSASLRLCVKKKDLLILLIIWLIGVIIDRIWFSLDKSVPAWDQADYLNGTMIYWNALKTPHFFSGEWWRSFWLLSNKIPPLTYIITAPFLTIFGLSADSATLVLSLFSAILLISIYSLGTLFFNSKIALYACILTQLIPGLYFYRLEFLLDYPLSAIVTFSFTLITFWYFNKHKKLAWGLAIVWGISLGIGFMIKQTSLFFLFFPIIFVLGESLFKRKWSNFAQLMLSFFTSALIFFPWYRTNWLLIFTSGKRATIDSAIAEGDPALNTIKAWTFYGEVLPYFLSWHLLIIPIICLIYLVIKKRNILLKLSSNKVSYSGKIELKSIIIWLAIFIIGGYLLSSLNINKDARYILPLLPVLSIIIAALIFSYEGKKANFLRIGIIILSLLLMLLNLFPLKGNFITAKLSPKVQHYPYLDGKWYLNEVISETIKISPYLISNIGVLPSTPEINQHNISFYGSIPNFQVFGRQVGVWKEKVEQDVNSLDWFLTKTGEQGSIPEAQNMTVQIVENSQDFKLVNNWQLPDKSTLKLYHRFNPFVKILPSSSENSKVKLDEIIMPEKASPGLPIPITYKWSGNWQDLQDGIVILTWYKKGEKSDQKWLHDHGIGLGNLHSGNVKKEELNKDFQVIENLAMLPNKDLSLGNYTLKATYLNRKTGENYPIKIPPININLEANIKPIKTPELDLVTQLRNLAPNLAKGIEGLNPVFSEIDRISQYDPVQNYLKISEKSLEFRLQKEQNLDYLYTLVLANVLQQDVQGAIASLNELIKIAPNNAYNHAYLAFLYLYDWKGKEAEKALQPALQLNPEVKEFKILDGISGLMQGNFIKAWQTYSQL